MGEISDGQEAIRNVISLRQIASLIETFTLLSCYK